MFYLGIPPHKRRERAMELAAKVGLEGRVHHRPMELSGGQQQRVCIARALVNDPLIVLADEPTGALDSKTGQQILALFDELVAGGRTIILVTHDPAVAKRCQRVIQLQDGVVIRDGHPSGMQFGEGHAPPPATETKIVNAAAVVSEN